MKKSPKDFDSFMTEVPIIIKTSPLVCRANQRTGFYMIGTPAMKELKRSQQVF